ncbi:MAG: hypothetical protein JNM39_00925 [Bdellovibrionaceae bacterium]|nr:hypothetical protein [Pseudobdellovibrionaceae bacterium]
MKLALALSCMLIGTKALNASAQMTMTNVQIQNCTKLGDACITVKSPNVQVSGLQMIFYMKQVEIEFKNVNSVVPTEKFLRQSGVLDFDSNQLVLNSIDADGTLIEEVYNLKTLRKQIFKTR